MAIPTSSKDLQHGRASHSNSRKSDLAYRGDVEATWADVSDLIADTGFRPQTSVEYGVGQFVKWYKEYYGA